MLNWQSVGWVLIKCWPRNDLDVNQRLTESPLRVDQRYQSTLKRLCHSYTLPSFLIRFTGIYSTILNSVWNTNTLTRISSFPNCLMVASRSAFISSSFSRSPCTGRTYIHTCIFIKTSSLDGVIHWLSNHGIWAINMLIKYTINILCVTFWGHFE